MDRKNTAENPNSSHIRTHNRGIITENTENSTMRESFKTRLFMSIYQILNAVSYDIVTFSDFRQNPARVVQSPSHHPRKKTSKNENTTKNTHFVRNI